MAAPISKIVKEQLSEEQIKDQKLENLKHLLAENEQALNQVFTIVSELNDMGALEAATKMVEAKEDVAQIALGQLTRKPVTNIINNMMGVAAMLTELNPETTGKLIAALNSGLDEANDPANAEEKVTIMKLAKLLKDPDVNRAMNFGVHFLRGLGKGLKE
ncbi:MAG TPA: DUF1641 domain-containing protein [Metalysinibacillus sp.]